MENFVILLVIFAVIAGMVWILRRQPIPKRRGARPISAAVAKPGGLEKLRSNNLFWGVKICHPGCRAARELQDQLYTFDEAPQLPVPGCDSANCTCQYRGLRERRVRALRIHEDRRDEVRFDKDHPERRSPKERRRSDRWKGHT